MTVAQLDRMKVLHLMEDVFKFIFEIFSVYINTYMWDGFDITCHKSIFCYIPTRNRIQITNIKCIRPNRINFIPMLKKINLIFFIISML